MKNTLRLKTENTFPSSWTKTVSRKCYCIWKKMFRQSILTVTEEKKMFPLKLLEHSKRDKNYSLQHNFVAKICPPRCRQTFCQVRATLNLTGKTFPRKALKQFFFQRRGKLFLSTERSELFSRPSQSPSSW